MIFWGIRRREYPLLLIVYISHVTFGQTVRMCFITSEILQYSMEPAFHTCGKGKESSQPPKKDLWNSQSSRLPQQRRTPGKLAIDSIPERHVITPLKQVTWTHQTNEAPTGSLTFPSLRTTDTYGWFGVVFIFPKGHLSCKGSILVDHKVTIEFGVWRSAKGWVAGFLDISPSKHPLKGVPEIRNQHWPPTNRWLQIAIRGKKYMFAKKNCRHHMSIFYSSKIMRYCHTATLKAWIQWRKRHKSWESSPIVTPHKLWHRPCQETRRTELPKHPAGSALTNRDKWWLSQEDLLDIMFKEFQTYSTSYTSNPSFLYTRVKSRWHSYLVLVYISPIFIYLLGTLIAMYFDHGLPSPGRHTGHPGSPQRKLPRGDGEITYSKPCARSYGKISHVSYGCWTIKQYWWCCWWKEMQLFVRLRCGLKNTKGIDQGFKEDEKCESPRWIVYVDIIKYVHIYIYRERERSTYTYK